MKGTVYTFEKIRSSVDVTVYKTFEWFHLKTQQKDV